MKKIVFTVIFLALFTLSQGQTSKEVQIRKLLELSGSGKIGAQVGQNMIGLFKKKHAEVPEEFWTEVLNEFNSDAIIDMVIPIYDKYYTESEINELIVFYNSEIGKKMIATMPSVVQESMQAGQVWGKELAFKIVEKLKNKNYIKEE